MDQLWTVLLLSILLSHKKMNNRMKTTEEEQQQQQWKNLAYECNGMNELTKTVQKGSQNTCKIPQRHNFTKTCNFCKESNCTVSASMF